MKDVGPEAYRLSLPTDVRNRYDEKTSVIGVDPYTIEASNFARDRMAWPDVTYFDVYNHLVCSSNWYTKDKFFQDDWIREVLHKAVKGYHLIKAKVTHSMRVSEKPLEPWVIVADDGSIQSAHCNCMAGLAEACSHKIGHSCAPPPNDTALFVMSENGSGTNESKVHYGKCSIDVTRNVSGTVWETERSCVYGMHYDKPKDFSFQSEFDLVCERAPLLSLSETLLMLGQGIGAVFFTTFSDRYGRKRIQVITHVLLIGCSVVIGLAPDYVTFAVFKVLVGAVQQGVLMTTVTANVESYPGRYRSKIAGAIGALVWALGSSTYVVWAYFLRDYPWRVLQLASTSVGVIVLLQMVVLKEPMRWLLANGRTDEVVQQLEKAARVNKRDVRTVVDLFKKLDGNIGEDCVVINADRDDVTTIDSGDVTDARDDVTDALREGERKTSPMAVETELRVSPAEKLSCFDLLRHRRLRFNVMCLWAVWFINSFIYFALLLMSGSFTGNVYLSFFLNVIVEIPACFVFMFCVERIGRRGTLIMFHCVAAVSLLASGVFISFKERSGMTTAAMVTSLIGKLGISGSFNSVFIFTPEIFPTNIRNLAIGTGSTAARVGGMIAPFVGQLADRVVWAPGVMFGVCNLFVVLLVRLLPESMGRELPQTLRDLEAWYDQEDAKDVKDSTDAGEDKDKDIKDTE